MLWCVEIWSSKGWSMCKNYGHEVLNEEEAKEYYNKKLDHILSHTRLMYRENKKTHWKVFEERNTSFTKPGA